MYVWCRPLLLVASIFEFGIQCGEQIKLGHHRFFLYAVYTVAKHNCHFIFEQSEWNTNDDTNYGYDGIEHKNKTIYYI